MARSDGAKKSDITKRVALGRAGQDRRTNPGSTPGQKAEADEAKLRSDWEGMAPRPDQESDDVAAPGALPSREESKVPNEI